MTCCPYPYPVIDKILDEKQDKEYTAVFLENDYLKVMILPELGGRMDYKTLSAILGHYSVAFTMDTYVHSMDEHKRREMDKMDDMFGMQYSISVENQPYPVLCTFSADGCTAHVPDFPKVTAQAPTLDAALLEVKQQIQKALRQYKNPPIPTKQEQIVVPDNSALILVKAS